MSNNTTQNLISFDEVINLARLKGVNFGKGDPYNRIRYYIKIGLLPKASRKSFNGLAPSGALPIEAVDKISEIDSKLRAGKSVQAILKESQDPSISPVNLEQTVEKPAVLNQNLASIPATAGSLPPQTVKIEPQFTDIYNKPFPESANTKPSLLTQAKTFNFKSPQALAAGLELLILIFGGIFIITLTAHNISKDFFPALNLDSTHLPSVNTPSKTLGSIIQDGLFSVNTRTNIGGLLTAAGGIDTKNSDVNAGSGKLTASNVIYGINAGQNVSITPGQNPTISVTALPAPAVNINGTASRITFASNTIDIANNYVGQTSINTLGTVTGGTWQASQITAAYLNAGSCPATQFVQAINGSLGCATPAVGGNPTFTQILSGTNSGQTLTVGAGSTLAAVFGTGVIRATAFVGNGSTTDAVDLGTAEVAGTLPNANLANSSITITSSTGLSGGGLVSLGGTLLLTNTGVISVSCTTITCSGTNPASFSIADGAIGNLKLTNSSLTVSAGTGLTGGGAVALGGTTTLTIANTAVAIGSYGSTNQVATFTVDQQGRLTAASNTSIAIDTSAITSGTLGIARGGTNAGTIGVTGTVAYSTGSAYAFTAQSSTVGYCLQAGSPVTSSPVWGSCGGISGITVRESDGTPSVATATTIEFGPAVTSSDEFIVTDQTGGVVRIRQGNKVVLTDASQVLTNKTLEDSTTLFRDNADTTKLLAFQLSGITTATTRTLTIPDNNGTIAISATSPIVLNSTTGDISCGNCLQTGGSLFNLAGSTGSNSSISQGGTATIGAGTGITTNGNGLGAVTVAVDQAFSPTWTGIHTFSPTGAGDTIFNGDNDSNLQVASTFTGTGPTINPVDIVLTDNATAAGTAYVLSVTNADNGANAGVPAALGYFKNANVAETVPNGLFIEQTGAGILTNAIQIKQTAGTIANLLRYDNGINNALLQIASLTGNWTYTLPNAGGTFAVSGNLGNSLDYNVVAANKFNVKLDTTSGTSATTSNSGLETTANGLTLLRSCTAGGTELLKWNGTAWVCAVDNGTGAASNLQGAYAGGNTITTTTGRDIVFTLAAGLATPTQFSLTNNHISNVTDFYLNNANASGTNTNGVLVEQTGAGTLTNGLNITRTAGTLTNGLSFNGTFTNLINSTTFVVSNSGVLSLAGSDATADITTTTSGNNLTIQPKSLATASGVGGVLTLKAGNETGTTSTGGKISIDSGTGTTINGSIEIGITNSAAITIGRTGGGALSLNGGAASNFTTGAGNIKLQPAGSGVTGNVQIGEANGGAGSTTPDLLVLDKTSSSLPTGVEGAFLLDSTGKFNIYEGGAWKTLCNTTNQACGSGSGSALSAISAATGGNTINNSDNAQVWNWALTTAGKTAFTFTENTAATNGAGSQYLVKIGTIAASTAAPLQVFAHANAIIDTTKDGGVTIGNASAAQAVTIDAGTATLNLGNSNSAKTINIGTGTAVDTINIATGGGADVVTIGGASATFALASTGATLTSTGALTLNNSSTIPTLDAQRVAISSNSELVQINSGTFTQTITGALANARFNQFLAPTLSAATAQTVTNAATVYIDQPPIASGAGPATITNAASLLFGNAANQIILVQQAVANTTGKSLSITSGSGNAVTLNTGQAGGNLNLTAGAGSVNGTAAGNGGDLLLSGGAGAGIGTAGKVGFFNAANNFITSTGAVTLQGGISASTTGTINNLNINAGTISGTLTTITPSAAFTVGATGQALTLQGNGSTTLTATSGGITNSLVFTLPATSNKSITIPNETGTICTSAATSPATCTNFAPSSGGSYLAKNAGDTSSASFVGNLYAFTNSNTGAAGVLSLTNAGTNSALAVTQSANPTANQALLFAKNSAASPSGNLLDLQVTAGSKFNVDATGAVTAAGAISAPTATNTINNLIINAGALSAVTGITFGTGAYNFDQSTSTGTFKTGSGAVSLNGDTTVASGKNLTLSGGKIIQTTPNLTATGEIGNSLTSTITGSAVSSIYYGNKVAIINNQTTNPDTVYGQHISFTDAGTLANTVTGLYVDATTANASDTTYAAAFLGGNVGVGTGSPTSLFSVGASSQFQVNSSGAIAAAAGITSSGSITFSGLSTAGVVHNSGAGLLSTSLVSLTTDVSGVLPIANGGTGSSTQNFVDLTTSQTVAGNKTWSALGTFNAGVTLAANQTLTLNSGTGNIAQTYINPTAGTASTLSVTNSNATGTATTVNGLGITLIGTALGTNTIVGINFPNVTPIAGNNFNGLNFGTGLNDLLRYNGNSVINGTGIVQTAFGGLGANVTAAGAGEILYSTATTTYGHLAAGTGGYCLKSGGVGAPTWNTCPGGSTASPFLSNAGVITKDTCCTNDKILFQYNATGDKGFVVNTTVAPTFDLTQIDVTNGTVTDGVDALSATIRTATGGMSNNSALHAIIGNAPADASDIINGLEVTGIAQTLASSTQNLVRLTPAATGNTAGTLVGLAIDAITTPNSAVENAITIGANWDSTLVVGGTIILNSTGILQSAGLSGTYTNALTLNGATNSITAGTLTATGGSINGTTIGATTTSTGAFTTLTSSGNTTLATGASTTNTFGSGNSSANTIGSSTTPGALTLHGATTLDNTFSVTGTIASSTGSLGAFNVTENLAATGSVNGLTVTPTLGGAATTNTYTLNAVNVANVAGSCPATATCTNNGIQFGTGLTNYLTGTNFTVTSAGAVTAVGVNSGSGSIQGTGGLTITGTTSINTSGTNVTNIGTGTNAGTITIGNATTGDLALNDPQWNITGAGAANFVSIGATTAGTGAFTTLSSLGTTTLNTSGSAATAIGNSVTNWNISTGGLLTLGRGSNATGQLIFSDSFNAFTTTIQQSTVSTASATYTLPTAAPVTNGSVLTSTTGGTLSWAAGGCSTCLVQAPSITNGISTNTVHDISGLNNSGQVALTTPLGGFGRFENLLYQSEDLSTVSWTKTGATVPSTTQTSPSGALTGNQILNGVANNGTVVQAVGETCLCARPYTFSVWLKKGVSANQGVSADLLLAGDGNGTTTTSSVTLTTSWQRFSVSNTSGTTTANVTATIKNTSGASFDILAWGTQLEQQADTGVYNATNSYAGYINYTTNRGLVSNGPLSVMAGLDRPIQFTNDGSNRVPLIVLDECGNGFGGIRYDRQNDELKLFECGGSGSAGNLGQFRVTGTTEFVLNTGAKLEWGTTGGSGLNTPDVKLYRDAATIALKTDSAFNVNGNFNVATTGVVTLAGAQTADITTTAGTSPTALIFQPGNNTTAISTGAAFTLQAGNDSGITTSTGGLLTLKGGNATGGSQTGGGIVLDSGSGTAGGAITIGGTNTASLALGRAAATFALTSSGGLNVTTAGALTGVASLDTITTSATALTFAAAGSVAAGGSSNLSLDAGTSGTVNIAGTSTGNVNLAGGSGGGFFGCTVFNATGNLTCDGTISGPTTGTVGYWQRDNPTTTLSPSTAGDKISITTSTSGQGIVLSSTNSTNTSGILQATVTSATSGNSGINLNYTSNATGVSDTQVGFDLTYNTAQLTNANNAYGLRIKNANNVGITKALIALDNANTTAQSLTSGILFQNSGGTSNSYEYGINFESTTRFNTAGIGFAAVNGTLINNSYTSSTQTGNITGVNLNFNTGFTGLSGSSITGVSFRTPTLTTTSGTTTYTGFSIPTAGAISNSTTGSFVWNGSSFILPTITQGAGGSVVANGTNIIIPTGAGSITTAGVLNGIQVGGTGNGALAIGPSAGTLNFIKLSDITTTSAGGTTNGISIGSVGFSGGTDTAINIGTGWDTGVKIADVTAACSTCRGVDIQAASLTTGIALNISGSTGLKTGSALNLSSFVYNHSANAESGSLVNLAFSEATNLNAAAITNTYGINIGSTVYVTGGASSAGSKTTTVINVAVPTFTDCSGGSNTCAWTGLRLPTISPTSTISTVNSINIAASTAVAPAATTLTAINIGAITGGGAGTATAINIGSGWDTGASVTFTPNGVGATETAFAATLTTSNLFGTGIGLSVAFPGTSAGSSKGVYINNNGTGLVSEGIKIEDNGGTISNGIALVNTSGTFTTGLSFTGTFSNYIVSPNFKVNNSGNITVASTVGLDNISSSSTLAIGPTNASTITIGSTNTSGSIVNVLTGNYSSNNAQFNVLNGTLSGTSAYTINIGTGSPASASTLTLGAADSNITSNLRGTTINIGDNGVTGNTINVGSTSYIAFVGTASFNVFTSSPASGGVSHNVNIATGTFLNTSTITIGSTTNANTNLNLRAGGNSNTINLPNFLVNNNTTNTGVLKLTSPAISATTSILDIVGVTPSAGTQNFICLGQTTNCGAITGGAGATNGLNIGNISGGAGTKTAIKIGTGWDASIGTVKSSAGASANSFTIKNDNATPVNLFEIRDLTANSNQFGSIALADAFVSRQSYFGEEFNSFRNQNCSDASFTTGSHLLSRGDWGNAASTAACGSNTSTNTGEITANSVSAVSDVGNTCSYSNTANNTNGFERIAAVTSAIASSTADCLETIGTNTANTNNNLFNTGNFPQIVMKVRPSASGSNQRVFAGISTINTAKTNPVVGDKGIYFTNCSAPTTPTCGSTSWVGVVQDGTNAANTVTCPSTYSTANFSYLRIEVRKNTSATGIEVQFFVDNDVTDGIAEVSCGTITSTTTAMGNTAMSMFLMAASTTTSTTTNFDIDYFRVWQDDNALPATTNVNVPTTTNPINLTNPISNSATIVNPDLISKSDIAGNYDVEQGITLEAGDIVSIGKSGKTTLSNKPYDPNLLGIVSTDPYQTIGLSSSNARKIALSGRVPTKVSTENGAIVPGDPLTSSSIPGVAMKATQTGSIVGKALEAYSETDPTKVGKILVFVSTGYYAAPLATAITPQAPIDATFANLTASKLIVAESIILGDKITLDKSGKLTVNGEVVVAGKITLTGDFTIKGNIDATAVAANEFKVKSIVNDPAATAGTATLLTGTKELVIHSTKVADTSLVFITPTTQTNQQLAVVQKIAGTSFKVTVPNNAAADITFNWIIVNQQISQGGN